ncbi:MAG: hypothetical protein EPN85_05840 [Bacteroidetes bacterium]|nr:MAG: hypothetical protein EPN85_05840 [Bacteroidota bacterium]
MFAFFSFIRKFLSPFSPKEREFEQRSQSSIVLQEDWERLSVYSDSVTAMHWVKMHKANTKLKATPENKYLFYLIERADGRCD